MAHKTFSHCSVYSIHSICRFNSVIHATADNEIFHGQTNLSVTYVTFIISVLFSICHVLTDLIYNNKI